MTENKGTEKPARNREPNAGPPVPTRAAESKPAETPTAPDENKSAETPASATPAADMFAQLKAKAVKVKAASLLVDKKTLVGVPFVIKSWALIPSESSAESRRTVVYAEITFIREDNSEGQFRDSSRHGIKNQLINLWAESNPGKSLAHGVVVDDTPILCPNGVEVRTFKTENKDGKEIDSQVYALSV
jgi:hypothetical protein